jgi:RNA polymerase sigma-70 factor (ECF subfamily)
LIEDRHQKFDKLFTENVNAVMAFALRRTHREDAKDVVSGTFAVAWRRLDDVPSEPLPWLIGVARNILLEQRRSEQRRRALDGRLTDAARVDQATERPDVADELIAEVVIRGALGRLSDADRDVLTLVAWEGLNTTELAIALDCSKATASLRLHRARKRFAKNLETGDGISALSKRTKPVPMPSTAREVQ